MRWSVAAAKQQLSRVIRESEKEAQEIYRRDELVAAVVDAASYREYQQWRRRRERSLGEVFAELRTICAEEGWSFEQPQRTDRANPLAEVLDETSV